MACFPTINGKQYKSVEELVKAESSSNKQLEVFKKYKDLRDSDAFKERIAKDTEKSKYLSRFNEPEKYADYVAKIETGVIKNPENDKFNNDGEIISPDERVITGFMKLLKSEKKVITEQLSPDNNISHDSGGFEGDKYFIDDGKREFPESYDTRDEAIVALNEINKENGFGERQSFQSIEAAIWAKYPDATVYSTSTRRSEQFAMGKPVTEVVHNDEVIGRIFKEGKEFRRITDDNKNGFAGDTRQEAISTVIEEYNTKRAKATIEEVNIAKAKFEAEQNGVKDNNVNSKEITPPVEQNVQPTNIQEQKQDIVPIEQKPEEVVKPQETEPVDTADEFSQADMLKSMLNDGQIEAAIKSKEKTIEEVKKEFKDAGLDEKLIDTLEFKMNNPELIKALKDGIPEGIDVKYLKSDLNEAIKDGRFSQAIRNGEITPEKATEILKYFDKKPASFKKDFDFVKEKQAEEIKKQLDNEQAVEPAMQNMLDVALANQGDMSGIFGNSIKSAIKRGDNKLAIEVITEMKKEATLEEIKSMLGEKTFDAYKKAFDIKEEKAVANEDVIPTTPEEPTVEEKPQEQKYVKYSEIVDGKIVEKQARVVSEGEMFTELINEDGIETTRMTDRLSPSTKEDFEANKKTTQGKYNIGDKVIYGANKTELTIKDVDVITDRDTGLEEMAYTTEEGIKILESGITGKAKIKPEAKVFEIRKEHSQRFRILKRISDKFEKLFPDIKSSIGYFTFDAPARFNKGIVEINIGYDESKYTVYENKAFGKNDPFKREVIAHEFMHPFVLALKDSNSGLYKNIADEVLRDKPTMQHVDNLIKKGTYKETDRIDEGIVIFLGKEITKAFTKDGTFNTDYVNESKKSLIIRFGDWLRSIVDRLMGIKKTSTIDEFVKHANSSESINKQEIKDSFKEIEDIANHHKKNNGSDIDKTIKNLKTALKSLIGPNGIAEGDRAAATEIIKQRFAKQTKATELADINKSGKEAKPEEETQAQKDTKQYIAEREAERTDANIDELITKLNDLIRGKAKGKFEFINRKNKTSLVEFDESNPNKIKVYFDKEYINDGSFGDVILKFAEGRAKTDVEGLQTIGAEAKIEELLNSSYYKSGDKVNKPKELNVAELNPLMTLKDLSNFVVKELSDESVKVKYDLDQMDGIDELVAYMNLSDDAEGIAKIRKKVVARLDGLKEVADNRLNNETLKALRNSLRKIDLDSNDENFVLEYAQQASASINMAWRKFNELREDAAAVKEIDDPVIAKLKFNRINKELDVIKQLTGFFDDFNSIYNKYDDSFTKEDLAKFNKSVSNQKRIADQMKETSIRLAVDWLMPYIDKHNEYLKQQGFTNLKYLIDEKALANNLRYGVSKDTNFITFNLGANVSSRDPVNASFSNIVADTLALNNVYIEGNITSLGIKYSEFLKKNGFSANTEKSQLAFYKQHYLRDAEMLSSKYNEKTGEFEDVYIKKAALHQEYKLDQYDKELLIEKKKYENPKNAKEYDEFKEHLDKWMKDRNYGESERYKNEEYAKVKDDPYFKMMSNMYNTANQKYGAAKLSYGIIPQKYSKTFIERLTNYVDDVKQGQTAGEKFVIGMDKAKTHFAGLENDRTSYNLDGSEYREVSSHLNRIKSEENIDLNLHITMNNFFTEAINYGSLKEIQYNAENLRMLIEGNYKFGIEGRTIAKEDFNHKITSRKHLREAQKRLAELDELKSQGKTYDEAEYKLISEKVDKGIEQKSLWDNVFGKVKKADTNRLNEQLLGFMDDVFYGKASEEAKLGSISLNKAAHIVSMYTSINNMAFNTVAGVSNVIIGNAQMAIEGRGGKYYTMADLGKAGADYAANLPNYIRDLSMPIKSKDTQLSLILDAIQGEITNEIGERVSGSLAKKLFSTSSLFFFTSAGEHQIQMTGMKAMLLGKKVETNDGKKITLYDAYTADKDGRYSLRKDLKNFSKDDLAQFIRRLHSVNRSLNGNYSPLHKAVLQRKWYGTLALKFRKYLYEAFRTRYSGERQDFEKNTVDVGYLNFFFKDYLLGNIRKIAGDKRMDGVGLKYSELLPHQQYAVKKSILEVGTYIGLSVLLAIAFGGKDKKKDLSSVEKAGLLYTVRFINDLGMYHVRVMSELQQQTKNPTASMITLDAIGKTIGQLFDPNATYQANGNGHQKGDSKLASDARKLLPIINKYYTNGKDLIDWDSKLSYFNSINQSVEGVTKNANAQ